MKIKEFLEESQIETVLHSKGFIPGSKDKNKFISKTNGTVDKDGENWRHFHPTKGEKLGTGADSLKTHLQ